MSWPAMYNDEDIPVGDIEIVSPVADDKNNPDCNKFATPLYPGTVRSTPRPAKPRTNPSAE